MNKTTWIIFSVVTVCLFVTLGVISNSNKIDVSSIDANKIVKAIGANGNIADHVYGNTNSKVILIEYADYQCPGCAAAHPSVKLLTEKYKDKMQYIFRNFPLSYHKNGKPAAYAAEAAGMQDKYWEMHNKIFESQTTWEEMTEKEYNSLFESYAKSLDLDVDKFNADAKSDNVSKNIDFDQALGYKVGIESTPTFFLNGTRLDNAKWKSTELESKLEATITDEIKKAE